MDEGSAGAGREEARHVVPVIETMMTIVQLMAELGRPMSISEIVSALGQPRSTVYRIVNTLQTRDWISPGPRRGEFRLGGGLSRIGQAASVDPLMSDLPDRARPAMEKAAAETGETIKLSVLRGAEVLVIGAVLGRNDSALITHVGTTTPITLGASAKVLLSGLSADDLRHKLAGSLTDNLLADIRLIAEQGWARDDGEYDRSTGAHAAPIVGSGGRVVAAVSILYLRSKAERDAERFRSAAITAAASISAQLTRA